MLGLKRLLGEFKELSAHPTEGLAAGPLSEENMYKWEAVFVGPPDTMYEDGVFRAILTFPHDYPLNPPKMVFTTPVYHPNIYPEGKRSGEVCISILHPPGDDQWGYEKAVERWSPVQCVEKILLSVISMLSEPNTESPANIEAAKMWRTNRAEYKRIVRAQVASSLFGAAAIDNCKPDKLDKK